MRRAPTRAESSRPLKHSALHADVCLELDLQAQHTLRARRSWDGRQLLDQPAPHLPPLHRRLTVAHVPADRRGDLLHALATPAAGDGVIELGPARGALDRDALTQRAAMVAARRVEARSVEASLAEAELQGALGARDLAAKALDDAKARHERILSDAAWCDEVVSGSAGLLAAVDEAAASRMCAASSCAMRSRGSIVALEQRAAAAAALEEAETHLADLDGAGLDETGLRRELETAGRELHEATIALEAARDDVAELERFRGTATDRLTALDAEVREVAATLGAARLDLTRLRLALDEYDRCAAMSAPDAIPQRLAAQINGIDAELSRVTGGRPTPPSPDEIAEADAAILELQSQIDALKAVAPRITPEERSALDAAHTAVLAAEDRTGRRSRRGAAERELADARRCRAAPARGAGVRRVPRRRSHRWTPDQGRPRHRRRRARARRSHTRADRAACGGRREQRGR